MPQTVQPSPAPTPSNFAGFLAALTEPEKQPTSSWSDDALEDDIATLSYEHALRARARYRSADATDQLLTQPVKSGAEPEPECPRPRGLMPAVAVPAAPTLPPLPPPAAHAEAGLPAPQESSRKCASITIRLSRAECEQLRQRAAEAGLTVSAYLRSCTFEAESLRALVKDTMAQLRAANTMEPPAAPPPPRLSWLQGRVRRLAGGKRYTRA
jgi:hypothetical protein